MRIFKTYSTAFVFAVYALLVVIFTYPLVFRMTSEIPKGGRDAYVVISNIDKLSAIIRTQGWYDGLLTLARTYQLNNYLPYIILGQFTNTYGANNIMFLLSLFLSAVGAYFLAFYFTKNRSASFLAGLVFAFSPFHIYQSTAIHVGSMHQELLPFFILFLFKFFEKFQFKYYVSTIAFAFLIALTEHQLLAFTIVFVLIFLVHAVLTRREIIRNRRLWAYISSSVIMLWVFIMILFRPLLKIALSENNYLDPGIKSAINLSAYAIDVILPPQFHGIWPGLNDFLQKYIFSTSHKGDSYYIGVAVLGMVMFLMYQFFRNRKDNASFFTETNVVNIRFWMLVSVVFFVIALGPKMSLFHFSIYLPYYLIYKFVPFYENIRTVGRFLVFTVLGMSMLVAYSSMLLQANCSKEGKKYLLIAMLSVLVMIEYCVIPMKTVAFSYSSFYDQIANDGGGYSLLEIPGSTNDVFFNYEWITRNVHHKELINGMPIAREIDGQFDFQQGTPVIKHLLYSIPGGNDPDADEKSDVIKPFDFVNSDSVLNYYNVRYITVSKIYADDETQKLAENFIGKHVTIKKRYEDRYLVAYEVAKKDPSGIFVEMKDEISQFNMNKDGFGYREMGDGATMRIVNMGSSSQKTKITVRAKSVSDLSISSSSDAAKNLLKLTNDEQEYSFATVLSPGENTVSFSVVDASGKAVKNSNKKKSPQGAMVSQVVIEVD